jgi:hypothetical protein
MERIAVIRDNGLVVNIILWADHTAEQLRADGITDFEEVTNLEPRPGVGWLWDESNGYRPPKPFPSWVWNGVTWEAPVPQPEGNYTWNEETQTWDEIPQAEPLP